ncbi:hypothetical protein B4096_2140 [Heyndrickxia coagulans]|uniref:Uncharacterized protein n=1 Tax=Heyndrickxia coagulans TaxID=1398 RepID=A0A150JWC5_HEYCO|nr:hypothetical protein B4098_1913 [Heyndrickxia coagulans]KYC62311.1 hypothetical protein B4100_2202 [Heyndrickxia coagulans]KYC79903.1 hypothetical protein B4096_2140 [Heyndrickxia coagulans]
MKMKKCKKIKKGCALFFPEAAGENGHMKKGAEQWLGKFLMKKRLMIPLI